MEPFASLAGAVRSSVPRVLINQDLVGPFAWQRRHNDIAQLGDVVSGVEKLVELLGWNEEMQTLIQKEKEKVGRGSGPCLPPSPSLFLVLELLRGLCLLGLDLHRHCHACSLHSEKRTTVKCKKPKQNPHNPKPQRCAPVTVPQSRALLLQVSVAQRGRTRICQPQALGGVRALQGFFRQ